VELNQHKALASLEQALATDLFCRVTSGSNPRELWIRRRC